MADQSASDDPPSDAEAQLALALKALSVIRHDLRNLLASVTIMANRMEASEDERLVKAAPLLVSSMERTVALGVRAGQIAALAAGEPRAVPLARVLELADPAGDAAVEGAEGLTVLGDEDQLAVLLAELIDNAHRTETAVGVSAAATDGAVTVRVSDGGAGIPDYAQDDLFTAFKGAKRRDGTGLGLPIAARLAALNGGALALETTGEGGTVFRLTLRRADG